MYLSIIILPLLGSIVSGFFGRKVGVKGAQLITCSSVIMTTVFAIIAFFEVGFNNIPVSIELFRWIDSEWFNISWGFEFDSLTVLFMGLFLEINAVLVLIQLCKLFIFKLYLYMFMYLPVNIIFNFKGASTKWAASHKKNVFFFISGPGPAASIANPYKLHSLGWRKRVDAKFNNILNIGLRQKMKYSVLKDISLASQSNIINPKGLPLDSTFLQWFVGFTDAEGNFILNPLKNTKLDISRFSFMFKITLHQDDEAVLKYINDKLGIGGVRYYKKECIFNVTDKEGIALLISIFDKYNLNTTKHLDFLDFKEAFYIYWNSSGRRQAAGACSAGEKNSNEGLLSSTFHPDLMPGLSLRVKAKILELKNKMNTNRTNYDRPLNSPIIITKNWLLGFIEGDGSFFIRRDTLTPIFAIEVTGVQIPVLVQIKEFIENSLGFDKYSLFKLKNSSIIAVTTNKARNNSKSSVSITISNISVLNNYFIPLFKETEFLTKKGKDFQDFKTICKIIYKGAHRKEDIRSLILKLANTMNNFRLSTNKEIVQFLNNEEMDLLLNASPTIERLLDGRVVDSVTKKILPKLNSCVYEIIGENGEYYLGNSLSEAASIVNIYPDTLSKHLDIELLNLEEAFIKIKTYKVRRVRVFFIYQI